MTTEHRDPRVRRLVFELVDAAPAPPPFPDAGVAVPVATRPRRARSWAVAALAALLVAGAVAAVVVVRRSPEPHPLAPPSPATVAYVDNRGLVVRAPSGKERVIETGNLSMPRWSPSGRWLAYRSSDKLSVVRADGSSRIPIVMSEAFSWSPTLDVLAVADGAGVDVWSFDESPPHKTRIDPPVGGVEPAVQSFAWSADGTSLAIAMQKRDHAGPGAPTDTLWLARGVCRPDACATPSDLRRIPYTPGPDDYPLLVTGFGFHDTQVLFWTDYQASGSIKMDGLPLNAVSIDAGGPAATVANTIVRDSWVRPSPDGSQLLVVRSNGRMVTDPREVDVCNSSLACAAIAAGRDVQTLDPAWSPDGHRIAFVREDHASFTPPVTNGTIDWTVKYRNRRLWIANADGSDAHEITAAGGGIADPEFAPDGQSIVFVRDAHVWQLDLATGHVIALTGSLRPAAACAFDDCLPDVAPYEAINLWSNYYAVKFAAAS